MLSISLISTTAVAQTVNFDETWKEFIGNDKISNMSQLIKPDRVSDLPDYAKYLLMNTNSSFCQSDVEDAEVLMAEIKEIDPLLQKSIPGYVAKVSDLESKIKAYYSMDEVWQRFLATKEVSLSELESIEAAKSLCEKQTLAKYSYMTAYYHFCEGDIAEARNIFENRTLRLTEKTSLRVRDVEGLGPEVAKMKSLFKDMSKLDVAWKSYLESGESPGFDIDLPLFPCYPIPNMKEFLLKGVADLCKSGPEMLDKIKKLELQSGVSPDKELAEKIKELEAAIKQNEQNLEALNIAWEAFIPDNRVKHLDSYGYEYCDKEAMIRAYIMDGFAFVCDLAEDMLQKIDDLQASNPARLEDITKIKINELAALLEEYQTNGVEIEERWSRFVAQGDQLSNPFQTRDLYCDNIYQVKDWTMQGLGGSCEEGLAYLEKIEAFQATFEFSFTDELECRVQKLRIKVWDCRYKALQEMASIDVSSKPYEERLKELLEEYAIGDRPEVCSFDK